MSMIPKDVWDKIASLFENQDDLRIYHLENDLISFNLTNFKTPNDLFTQFKHLVFQLKHCGEEKKDDQLIISFL